MSLSEQILRVWALSQYTPPAIPLIYYNNEYMLTVDDSNTFLRFMSVDGQVFLALNTNCQLGEPPVRVGDSVYVCNKVDPILCGPTEGPGSERDWFVLNNITPLLQ